jgi:hypothetical protein
VKSANGMGLSQSGFQYRAATFSTAQTPPDAYP